MTRSVVQALIRSDWDRQRKGILLSLVGGLMALALLQVGGELPTIIGSTWFFISLIVLGCMLPVSNVINERKKQTLPFLMSLPLSSAQYTAAKIVSTMGMFIVPWLVLLVAAVSFVLARPGVPNGIIPTILILMMFTFVGFCLIAGIALISESEGWTIAATVAANSTYGLGWYLLVRDPVIRAGMGSPTPVWSAPVLTILLGEFSVIAAILCVTVYVQSRKRDFI